MNTTTSEACDRAHSRACCVWKASGCSNRFRVFVWTGKYDSNTLGVEADIFTGGKKISVFKNTRIRVDAAKEN